LLMGFFPHGELCLGILLMGFLPLGITLLLEFFLLEVSPITAGISPIRRTVFVRPADGISLTWIWERRISMGPFSISLQESKASADEIFPLGVPTLLQEFSPFRAPF